MIAAMLYLYLTPYGCYTLAPADATQLVKGLGYSTLAMAELQNRNAGVKPWWLQENAEDME